MKYKILMMIFFVLLALLSYVPWGRAHDWHLWDVQQLTSVRMQYCEGYMLAETEEFGILLIEKVGDMHHQNLHITKVDEYECVYETEPLTLED